eukprot:UN11317
MYLQEPKKLKEDPTYHIDGLATKFRKNLTETSQQFPFFQDNKYFGRAEVSMLNT